MELKTLFAQDTYGNIITSPTVYVYEPGTTTLVPGITDKNGESLTNPFTGGVDGSVQMKAPDGSYDILIASGGRQYTVLTSFFDSVAFSADSSEKFSVRPREFSNVSLMLSASDLELGERISWKEYHENTGYGGNSGTVVSQGSGVADGGSYFQCTGTSYMVKSDAAALFDPISFGAKNDVNIDSILMINKCILFVYELGGGNIDLNPGEYFVSSPILIPSNITLDLTGCTITAKSADINIIESAYVYNGSLISNISEYGSSSQGAGTHFCRNSNIIGGTLKSANRGIRGHRLNYNSHISGVTFDSSLNQAWLTTHCWGLKVSLCSVYCHAILSDFVDWTEICNNSFEGAGSTVTQAIGLTIQGSYGGSYSLNIHNNGFHHLIKGISCDCEMSSTIINNNHFEDTVLQIYGNSYTKRQFKITNNWMKANLLVSAASVVAIQFVTLYDSVIDSNRLTTDGASSFLNKLSIPGSLCLGNTVVLGYNPTNGAAIDLTGYDVGVANKFIFNCGSNDSSVSHPEQISYAGTSGFTIEKYKSAYNNVNNNIPHAVVSYSGSNIVITTEIPATSYGTTKLCKFNLRVVGSSVNNTLAGMFCMSTVTLFCNINESTGGAGSITITPSVSSGFVVLTLSAPLLTASHAVKGWIKEE